VSENSPDAIPRKVEIGSGRGPLSGIRIVEFAGIGPAPFACMMMADMGANIVRIERPTSPCDCNDLTLRSRRQVELDLKNAADRERALLLIEQADVLVEGFRPGVMERLGLGPDIVAGRNSKLVYGRITGWGQTGLLSQSAGHDINYIALSGALGAIGSKEYPIPPLNLVGDYGGGALYLVVGILAALLESSRSGHGQVVDAAMCDGAASLMTLMFGLRAQGEWDPSRASNLLDGGAPYYRTYCCSDGKHISIGALEPQFYRELCRRLGRADSDVLSRLDKRNWADLTREFETIFASKSSAEWADILEGSDACFAPVVSLDEAPSHPHNLSREIFIEIGGKLQPAPAPRFSRTQSSVLSPPPSVRSRFDDVLSEWS
jgi:alpha-methylacyl-CoA racemase